MDYHNILSIFVWSTTFFSLFLIKKDIFTPDKFFSIYLFVFYGGVFVYKYDTIIYFLFCLLNLSVMIGAIISFMGKKKKCTEHSAPFEATYLQFVDKKVFIVLWALSMPGLIAKLYIINLFGGFDGYINSIQTRVVDFRGLGPWLAATRTLVVINVVYISFILISNKRTKLIWFFYIIHLIFCLFLSLLTGSRGALLGPFLAALVTYHILINPVSIKKILIVFFIFFFAASTIGVVRQGIKMVDGKILTGYSTAESTKENFELSAIEYGTKPLSMIINQDGRIYYGFTYITIFTNFIPRNLWPSKPDTGGVLFTKEYTGDAWEGYSNLATGLLTEAIMNFGTLGILIACFQVIFMIRVLSSSYIKIRKSLNIFNGYLKVMVCIVYVYFLLAFAALLVGEFTATIIGLLLQTITLMFIILSFKVTRVRLKPSAVH